MYIKIALNSINYGFKYFIFILFEVIIYTLITVIITIIQMRLLLFIKNKNMIYISIIYV